MTHPLHTYDEYDAYQATITSVSGATFRVGDIIEIDHGGSSPAGYVIAALSAALIGLCLGSLITYGVLSCG